MGIKIFRFDNWNRIKNGNILRRDLMGLHPDRDVELIRYLIAHAPEASRSSMMKYAAEKYNLDEMPEPPENIDDPNDAHYEVYFVLQEQVAPAFPRASATHTVIAHSVVIHYPK